MNDFRDFGSARTSEMFVTRIGWWRPYYELSDGQFIYARLSYKGTFKRYAIIDSAADTFTIKRKSLISRTLMFNRGEDETIGELQPSAWKRDVELKMNNGFEAIYLFKKLFSRAYTLTSNAYGDILDVKQIAWGIKKPFTVSFAADNYQQGKPDVAVLTMIGVHFILYRQQQAAAAS
ncbi:hypothetical protein D0C36_18395 [Mucilaginibacter conchicola]|uniref:Uncharacterized protein n=1 Tax=Mucilaginibacter conchicola TaxID=2303333 RepID=A0A372NQJ2_9SPHI|nr:hypothetical protein [Mucilaginibacter conchicola]RFZ90920.1 hypothetical protein D0C36_18395 [Mucilaginibacter conchicola]